jgi:O-antigen/teichoic acid export membrane protein
MSARMVEGLLSCGSESWALQRACRDHMTHAAPHRAEVLVATWRRPGIRRSLARTAGFNALSVATAGLGGVILARALGPTLRGEYAAVTSWFGFALMVGAMGQPAALCFHVARDPEQAREYVATSRAMMLGTGILAVVVGILLAPVLGHRQPSLVLGYRLAFGVSIVAFVTASYTYALQARDLQRWNVVRVSQPALSLLTIIILWRLRILTLDTSMLILWATMIVQLICAYRACRLSGLAPGRVRAHLIRPLTVYGLAQIAAVTPAALNADLDQLVLSQTVRAADLGCYAIAVSLTSLPIPLVAAIGNVAFPRLASQKRLDTGTRQLQRFAVVGSAGLALCMLLPLALVAYWVVPVVFGASYRSAVPLLWILSPGAVFLACGQVVGDLLRGLNRPVVVAWAQGFAVVFTVVLLFALLPTLGVCGAAVASTVAYGIALAVMLYFLRRLGKSSEAGGCDAQTTIIRETGISE